MKDEQSYKEEIQNIILFNKPEIEIFRDGNLALCCEVDMFNNHLIYFVREYKESIGVRDYEIVVGDYEYHSDYMDAITDFLNKMEVN